ncbi:DUF2550 domain-containing protein [Corynebacterium halotolerans]|uniref:DUF2550 domain-containing protein n=1 Tax=Corynebacterium halotolerans TaxID=225326 RepID=UPI003CE7B93C
MSGKQGSAVEIITWALVVLAVLAVLLAAWRFFTQRSRGTVVILRRLPNTGTHGWRHGSIRYNGDDLEYFKLRSLSPMADLILNRTDTELEGRRELTGAELEFMPSHIHVLEVTCREDRYEIGIGGPGEMAFTAWVEAAPDRRRERMDPTALRRQIARRQGRRD